MKIDPSLLLKQLASGSGLAGLGQSLGLSTPGVDQASFADLLSQARDGTLTSKLPVTIQQGANVSLTDDQLARLSLAADKCEAAGVKNALIHIDGKQVVLDVHSRQVTGTPEGSQGVVSGIDGVIDLGNSGAPGAISAVGTAQGSRGSALLTPLQATPGLNASLARILQTLEAD